MNPHLKQAKEINTMKIHLTAIVICMLLLISSGKGAENDRFKGGSDDGWDRKVTIDFQSIAKTPRATAIIIR